MSARLLELFGVFMAGGLTGFLGGLAVSHWNVWRRNRAIWRAIGNVETTTLLDEIAATPLAVGERVQFSGVVGNVEGFNVPSGNVEPIKRKATRTTRTKPKAKG